MSFLLRLAAYPTLSCICSVAHKLSPKAMKMDRIIAFVEKGADTALTTDVVNLEGSG